MPTIKKTRPDKEVAAAAKKRKYLIATIALGGVILLASLLCLFFYLPPALKEKLFGHFLIAWAMALIVYIVGRFISGAVLRDQGCSSVPVESSPGPGRKNIRFVLTIVTAVAVQMVLVRTLGPSSGNPMLFDLLFYMVFFAGGLMLARDQDSEHAPVLFALIVVVVLSILRSAIFLSDPTAVSRYGSARHMVGLRNLVVWVNMLPLEAAIAWAAWRVSRANRLRPASTSRG
jgi:hypothetical protein